MTPNEVTQGSHIDSVEEKLEYLRGRVDGMHSRIDELESTLKLSIEVINLLTFKTFDVSDGYTDSMDYDQINRQAERLVEEIRAKFGTTYLAYL